MRQLGYNKGIFLCFMDFGDQFGKCIFSFLTHLHLTRYGFAFLIDRYGFHPDHTASACSKLTVTFYGTLPGSSCYQSIPALNGLCQQTVRDCFSIYLKRPVLYGTIFQKKQAPSQPRCICQEIALFCIGIWLMLHRKNLSLIFLFLRITS